MAGFNSGLAPDVVKTALDAVFIQEYMFEDGPEFGSVLDDGVFHQSGTDRAAVITEVFSGTGLWQERAELQDVNSDTVRVANQQTFSVVNFANSVDISKNLFDDDQHDTVEAMMRDFGRKARITRENKGMEVYRLGFTTTLTADGAAWFSNSHTNLAGATVDNLETGALDEANLNTMIIALRQQVDQANVVAGYVPSCLLVPPALYKTAVETTDSELRSGTANNDLNVYSSRYGITVKQSQYLGSAVSGGSDTAYFLLSQYHNAYRWERQGITTDLVDWRVQRNNNYIYKGEFREVYGVGTYEGAIGSNGTT